MTKKKKQKRKHHKVNRNYKARIFEMIFQNRQELLGLYNAVNGTDYKNPDNFL